MEWFIGEYAYLFSAPALFGTAYFLISLLLGELGGDADVDLEIGEGGDSPVAEFRVLSLQTISAFAMGSGWMGLGAYRLLDLGPGWSGVVALVSGVATGWLMAWLLRGVLQLQGSGNIQLDAVLGQTGTVRVVVPPKGGGSGRVAVVVSSRRREYNAVQHGDDAIASNTRVGIIGVDHASNTVSVEVI